MAPLPNPGPAAPLPPRPPRGTNPLILLLALAGLGALLVLAAAVAWGVARGVQRSPEVVVTPPSDPAVPRAKLPPVERHVPHHGLSILDGCSDEDVHALASGIDGAISVGAPLYNAGNFAGCYHMYEGTAADVARKLGRGCAGPQRALEAGRTRAASQGTPSAQAWAMRDAFDGLLDVIERRDANR